MPHYLFHLGHEPLLSQAEIEAVFRAKNISFELNESTAKHLIIRTKKPLNEAALMLQLGGTVKISERYETNRNQKQAILEYLTKNKPGEFAQSKQGKIEFSLSGPGAEHLAITIKKDLKSSGYSARYIPAKNTATILHNKLVEKSSDFTLLNSNLYITRAIQPIEDFTRRDYGRPRIDRQSGMLPPKLARLMINLAEAEPTETLLDPFCGSGAILIEALSLGFKNIIGSDLSQKAVENTKENVKWFYNNNVIIEQRNNDINIFPSDVNALTNHLKPNSIDIIITEPYLGRPLRGNETKNFLIRQAIELRDLYHSAFVTFSSILKPNGTVIFIIPQFKHKQDWITIDALTDIKKIGFTPIRLLPGKLSLLYARPQQSVGRTIYKFKKTN